MKRKTIAVSGGFDPLHYGHILLLKEAAEYGDLIVLVNTDDWLKKKKGYYLLPIEVRIKVLENIRYVERVLKVIDEDDTVCKTLEKILPDYFANGGDRKEDSVPEVEVCERIGAELLWNIGGSTKTGSSSDYFSLAVKSWLSSEFSKACDV